MILRTGNTDAGREQGGYREIFHFRIHKKFLFHQEGLWNCSTNRFLVSDDAVAAEVDFCVAVEISALRYPYLVLVTASYDLIFRD